MSQGYTLEKPTILGLLGGRTRLRKDGTCMPLEDHLTGLKDVLKINNYLDN